MSNLLNYFFKYSKLSIFFFFIFSAFFSISTWNMAKNHYHELNQEKFENYADESVKKIKNHLLRCGDVLTTGVSFVNASDYVSREDWHNFVAGLNIKTNYPGMQGFGFTVMLKPNEVAPMEQKMRTDGFAQFALKPQGDREEYSTILYLEPLNKRNLKAIGFDMYSNPTRKAAMDLSRNTDQITLSGKVTLVQEIDANKQAGILIYAPLYKKGINNSSSLKEKQGGLIGFVYAPFRMDDLLNSTGANTEDVDIKIYDSRDLNNESLMYDSHKKSSYVGKYAIRETITLYNHTWAVLLTSSAEFDATNDNRYALWMTTAALAAYFILISIIFSLLKSRYLIKLQTDELNTTQNELIDKKTSLQTLLDSVAEGIYGLDAAGNCIFVNKSFLRILEYENESEILGKNMHHLIHHSHANGTLYPIEECKIFKANDAHKSVHIDDEVFWKRDRTPVDVEYWSYPMLKDGAFVGSVATFLDIQERILNQKELIAAKEAAEASARGKAEFLATMSHEIRTPMNGVLGMLGLLDQSKLDSTQKHHVHVAISSATSLLGLINDILDFSKIEAGKMDLEMLEFDIKNELQDFVESLEYKAYESGLKLTLDTTEITYPNIITDPGRLRQILTNIVGNSMKFTQQGEVKITVSLTREDTTHGRLFIDVSDTGIGIQTDKIATLFEPFTQADGSTTRKYGGTGLGLSIVKKLCELLGGSIRAASEPGHGSTFSVNLAVELGSDQVIVQNTTQEMEDTYKENIPWPPKTRILLVEDNATNQLVAQGMLESIGLQCDIAANGLEALEAIRLSNDTQTYTIVLMDCQMPEMDGYDATRAIRAGKAGEENKQLPIVAMTANAMQGDREKCTDAGMNDYISKPINLSVLKSALIKWILKGEAPVQSNNEQPAVEQIAPENLPLWDKADALKRIGNNSALLHKIIESFMNDGLKSLNALRTALDEGNSEHAQLYAHSLKGAAGNVGALKLQNLTKHLEEAAKNNNLTAVREGFEECAHILNETLTLMKAHLAKDIKPVAREKRLGPLQMAIKLQNLKKEVEQGTFIDTDAIGIFVEYADKAFNENMRILKAHIDRFESDEAINVLNEIMAGLE